MVQAAVGGGLPRLYILLAAAGMMLSLACAGRGAAFELDAAPEVGPDVPIVPVACRNGNKDLGETDIDCGGNACGPCDIGQGCASDFDCAKGTCELGTGSGKCTAAAFCSNTRRDSSETDVDCGGDSCVPCAANKRCTTNDDCASLQCVSGSCN